MPVSARFVQDSYSTQQRFQNLLEFFPSQKEGSKCDYATSSNHKDSDQHGSHTVESLFTGYGRKCDDAYNDKCGSKTHDEESNEQTGS